MGDPEVVTTAQIIVWKKIYVWGTLASYYCIDRTIKLGLDKGTDPKESHVVFHMWHVTGAIVF